MEIYLETDYFNAELTLTGGQAFRWRRRGDRYFGIAGNRTAEIKREENGIRLFCGDYDGDYWENYLDINTDYNKIIKAFSEDATLCEACRYAHGLRILKQEPFEALISFIISQNNNIPRITGIIDRLCTGFGEKLGGYYAFPTAEVLARADLSAIGAGYRAGYITDAAAKVQSGEINLNALFKSDTADAKALLMRIKGVGEKVADCVLLFAYGKSDAFPRDVHVKRALAEFYPDGLPDCAGAHEGLAQQYLFEYIRNRHKQEENLCSVQNAGADSVEAGTSATYAGRR
jgi:N-glycosylase/DNA lyase